MPAVIATKNRKMNVSSENISSIYKLNRFTVSFPFNWIKKFFS
jgi:hypothetical protein